MAVTIDAIFNSGGNPYISGVGGGSIPGLTVGSGANALLFGVIIQDGTVDYSTLLSTYWDYKGPNQAAMTPLGSYRDAGIGANVLFYGVLNPTPGAKDLGLVGATGKNYIASAISLKGVNAV